MKQGVRVRIEGDDATAAAFRSALGNAKTTADQISRHFSTAFQVVAGYGVAQGFRKIVALNVDANADFARSIDGVKSAFAELFTLDNSSMKYTVDQMDRLAATLRDPAVQDGADKLVGTLARVGGTVVEGWALLAGQVAGAVKSIRDSNPELEDAYDEQVRLSRLIGETFDAMQAIRAENRDNTRGYDAAAARLARYREELAGVRDEILRLQKVESAATSLEEIRVTHRKIPRKESTDALEEIRVNARRIRDEQYFENLQRLTQTSTERQIAELNRIEFALEELREAGRISAEVFEARWGEALDEVLQPIKVTAQYIGKTVPDSLQDLPDHALRAADRAQWAFEEFFFDPVNTGIKGLGRELIDTLRASIAEGLADKLFSGKESGGLGWGDAIAGFIGNKLPGFASGGSFEVGGSGGTDSKLVAFKATPGELVDIRTPGQIRDGASVTIHNHIDARGATTDLVRALPAILDQNSRATEARVLQWLNRRGYTQ